MGININIGTPQRRRRRRRGMAAGVLGAILALAALAAKVWRDQQRMSTKPPPAPRTTK